MKVKEGVEKGVDGSAERGLDGLTSAPYPARLEAKTLFSQPCLDDLEIAPWPSAPQRLAFDVKSTRCNNLNQAALPGHSHTSLKKEPEKQGRKLTFSLDQTSTHRHQKVEQKTQDLHLDLDGAFEQHPSRRA